MSSDLKSQVSAARFTCSLKLIWIYQEATEGILALLQPLSHPSAAVLAIHLFPAYHLILSLVPQLHLQVVESQREGTTWSRTVSMHSPAFGLPPWDLPEADELAEGWVPDIWLWRKSWVPAIHICPASVQASLEETSRTYNSITSRQGSWRKHILKTSQHHCCLESIAFWALRNKSRKPRIREKVRTVTLIVLAILCFSACEKQSNFKYPVHFFFYAFPPFHWTESTFIYVFVCTGMN